MDYNHLAQQAQHAIVQKADQQRVEEVRRWQEKQQRQREEEELQRAIAAENRRQMEQTQQRF